MFYIYILYSVSFDKFYIGYSSDYKRRLIEHNCSDKPTFTGKHRPWILKAVFSCGISEGDAIRIERFIKAQKSRNFLERLIDEDFIPQGYLAQLIRVPQWRD